NLLENAAKYGREGGLLSITLEQVDGHPRLHIENTVVEGPDIPVDRLFEPFYRQDASRSAKLGGNGLGLAICRAVAKANGWEIALRAEGSRILAQVEFLS
ncbi:MAG: sensor histidine kinase, partial [Chlorobia bacterium]|nr:sensor histidine kinase [Fimbriimonadaceae bacterium]